MHRKQLNRLSSSSFSSHDQSSASDFEEQREALERDYTAKIERLREELEQKNAEDRARYLQELDALRQQSAYTPTSDSQEDSEDDPRKNSTYELLQSIPYMSVRRDLEDRVVVGREREEEAGLSSTTSPAANEAVSSEHFSTASLDSSSSSSPNLSSYIRHTSITQNQVDNETVDINLVERITADVTAERKEEDMADGEEEEAGRGVEIGGKMKEDGEEKEEPEDEKSTTAE